MYWLTQEDGNRLIRDRGYNAAPDTQIGVMVISDRISAFECVWKSSGGLNGVPGKGAALNAISHHWFQTFEKAGLAGNHILEVPHPLVWIVKRARPIMLEGIVRGYITGSMWRSYAAGGREICGVALPEGLTRDQLLPEALFTPSTKGILRGIPGVPEADDVNVSLEQVRAHLDAFALQTADHLETYERLLREGFSTIQDALRAHGLLFVDTKFELGYAENAQGETEMIYIDEVGTPDSSRIWDAAAYDEGRVVENSKEAFRQILLAHLPESELLLDKTRMDERLAMAAQTVLPPAAMLEMSAIYTHLAEQLTGRSLEVAEEPRNEILDVLGKTLQILQ